jgi:flagellar protein FlaJ
VNSLEIKITQEIKVLIISLLITSALILAGFLSGDIGILSNTIFLSVFIIAPPQLLLRYKKYRELKEMEEKFPTFLRDLTESIAAGVPFHQAIVASSKLQYGALSKEIKKISNQISWGIPLDKILDQFAERVKRSRRLYTAIKIIRESYISGGDVVSILESVADNSTILEESEKERKSLLSQYTMLLYAISLIFIVVVVAINRLMVPIFQTPGVGEFAGLINPCGFCAGFTCSVCTLFESTAEHIFFLPPLSIGAYYTSLFFFMSLIQSIFCGLVAGQVSENSVTAGIKHSLILGAITVGSFLLLVRLGIMGV